MTQSPSGAARIITHGCRSNLAEADALGRWAPAGVTLINSCAVTAEAVSDARKAAKLALKAGGDVWLTGCAAVVAPDRFLDLGARIVAKPDLPAASTRRSRAFVSIQDGCDHACTFCVTRIARGRARSAPLPDIVAAVGRQVESGAAEVVLTGVDATSWGPDLGAGLKLPDLVEALLREVPGLKRLRLSTLDPGEIDDRLVALFADPRLMPHVHLSLQSGDALVLKRMRRRHTPTQALRLVSRLKSVRPEIAVGADLIAGFPTEGEAAHANSLAAIADLDIVHAHVFPYSPRPGTAAARMPQVPPGRARERARELRALSAARRDRWLRTLVGTAQETVSEGDRGLTPGFAELRYRAPRPRGMLVLATPESISDGLLME